MAVWLGTAAPALTFGLASHASAQQGTAVLVGRIQDAESGKPIVDAVVTVTSTSLQGEELAVTDASGMYRIPDLPPGTYVLRVEKENFRPYARDAIELHADTTIRLNASILPEALKAKEVLVVGRTPTVDVGSSATGMNITSDFTTRIPLSAPGARGSAVRSIESVAEVVPGAQFDAFGVSIFGTSSPENRYLLDGLSVSNPTFGTLGTPLSIDFIKEISVLTGGYMPEYGRSTGGILNAITKSGSNDYHGSVWLNFAPGSLEGHRQRVQREAQTIVTQPKLAGMGDVGGDVSGPIIRDRLWFYAGFDAARTQYNLKRSLWRTLLDDQGSALTNDDGTSQTELIPGTTRTFVARQDMFQGIGKLTWAADRKNRFTFSYNGAYPISGGSGRYGVNPMTGQPEIGTENTSYTQPLNGTYSALAHRYPGSSNNVLAKWSSELMGKKLLLDSWVGWHNESGGRLPADGSRLGGTSGSAGISNVWWVRNDPPHNLADFEKVPGNACTTSDGSNPCPVTDYRTGGPEYLSKMSLNRVQARSIATYLFEAFGHHVLKLGVDYEHVSFHHEKAYSGARDYMEAADGSYFLDGRVYGYLTGPDTPAQLGKIVNDTRSESIGGFVQDSWSIADRVTLNAGLRYDAQFLYAASGDLAMTLPNQLSPRVGLIWDPTYEGRAKIFTNYARYFETVPLQMLDRYLTGEPLLFAARDPSVCNPLDPANQQGACLDPSALFPGIGTPPNSVYSVAGAGTTPIDPKLKAPSTDEFVLGGEYEILRDGRIGVSYTKRWLNRTIEDMSRNEASTFFFGNPGYGIASDFPKARRLYDGVTLYFTKLYSQGWLAQASYTASWLRGNYGGLYRAEDLQFDPHMNADFDLRSLITNSNGYLPGDHRHFVKAFTSKDFDFKWAGVLTPGVAFRAYSGDPVSALGAHPLYGLDRVYILPRGSEERLPWTYSGDLRLAYGFKLAKGAMISITMDVFNLFNFQNVTARDQRYTATPVLPVTGGGGIAQLQNADGTAFDPAGRNPNYLRPVAYQPPRVFRFGVKGTF
jgi:Carboxypeptidase regulatory-like domain/TonB dependent receptor/TonB-dependent Receptor Plug Domain